MELTPLHIQAAGLGAVSPAGWGVGPLLATVRAGEPLPVEEIVRAPGAPRQRLRRVPKPAAPPPHARHPRLRRTSPIAGFAVAAALEALGDERAAAAQAGRLDIGVISVALNGCVNFSRRFYGEALADPSTASPIVFPETVFNAPSSHLSALLGLGGVNDTLVGDTAQFLAAFDLAALWLEMGEAEGVLVVAAEEIDWLSAEGAALLDPGVIIAEGAAAVYLEKSAAPRTRLSPARLVSPQHPRTTAARRLRDDWRGCVPPDAALYDGLTGSLVADAGEKESFADWTGPRLSVKKTLGEGLAAGTGWQCVAALADLHAGRCPAAFVPAIGTNQQALGALFAR